MTNLTIESLIVTRIRVPAPTNWEQMNQGDLKAYATQKLKEHEKVLPRSLGAIEPIVDAVYIGEGSRKAIKISTPAYDTLQAQRKTPDALKARVLAKIRRYTADDTLAKFDFSPHGEPAVFAAWENEGDCMTCNIALQKPDGSTRQAVYKLTFFPLTNTVRQEELL